MIACKHEIPIIITYRKMTSNVQTPDANNPIDNYNFVPTSLFVQKGVGFFEEEKKVVLRSANGSAYVYPGLDELIESLREGILPSEIYDSFVNMYVYDKSRNIPQAWPRNLQNLDMRFSKCSEAQLPPFPPHMRNISFVKCPLLKKFDVPRICMSCPHLETIVLYGSGVRLLHDEHRGPIVQESEGSVSEARDGNEREDLQRSASPPSPLHPRPHSPIPIPFRTGELRMIDASACPVHSIDLIRLPTTLSTLLLEYNCKPDEIDTALILPYDYRFHRGLTVQQVSHYRPRIGTHNVDGHGHGIWNDVNEGNNVHHRDRPPFYGIWNDGHNVHNSSVQHSTNTSIRSLNRAFESSLDELSKTRGIDRTVWDKTWLEDCRSFLASIDTSWSESNSLISTVPTWHKMVTNCLCGLRGIKNDGTSPPRSYYSISSEYLDESFTHSVYALTIKELLKRVWTVTTVHPSKTDMSKVLLDEMRAGSGWCFTGRFTRILNTLCGYVDDIDIGISPEDQVRNRLAVLWKKVDNVEAGGMSEDLFEKACREVIDALSSNSREVPDSRLTWHSVEIWLYPFVEALLYGNNQKGESIFNSTHANVLGVL